MSVALFVTLGAPGTGVSDEAIRPLAELIRGVPALVSGYIYQPLETAPDHPFSGDGSGPALALELRFERLAETEAALVPDRLGRIADAMPSGAEISHQAFAARDFATADPDIRSDEPCTFLVRYPGPAADAGAWLDHYDACHPPIMVRFPGIRRVATYRPIPWTTGLPWLRDTALQRNKVVFDSPAALAAALASPVMAEMRADRDTFPPFEGKATHFPMRTVIAR